MEIGYITKIVPSRDTGKLLGYDENGKVILIRGNRDLKVGYGEITDIYKEYERYYVCRAKNIQYDYYKGITSNGLIRVLKMIFNYKVGFRYRSDNGDKYTFLYNLKYKSVVIINEHGKEYKCTIYCPGIEKKLNVRSNNLIKKSNNKDLFSIFNLESITEKDPLHYIHNKYNNINCSDIKWGEHTIIFTIPKLYEEFSHMEHKEDLNILFEENSKMRKYINMGL